MNIDKDRIVNEVRTLARDLTRYSEAAQSDSFLGCYANTTDFLAVSADGVIRNYPEFIKICAAYYDSLREQRLTTREDYFHIVDDSTVVWCWSGNIDAFFKNGGVWKMQQYTVTYILRKIGGKWKVAHSHDSGLPPQIVK
jgi:ketosteroid isomerase-like protein